METNISVSPIALSNTTNSLLGDVLLTEQTCQNSFCQTQW